jgi:hypothetical protein
VASKLIYLLRRYPVVMFVLLLVLALIAARCGWRPGLWDGPI